MLKWTNWLIGVEFTTVQSNKWWMANPSKSQSYRHFNKCTHIRDGFCRWRKNLLFFFFLFRCMYGCLCWWCRTLFRLLFINWIFSHVVSNFEASFIISLFRYRTIHKHDRCTCIAFELLLTKMHPKITYSRLIRINNVNQIKIELNNNQH